MHLCSFGPAVTLLGILFICMHLCSFVNAVALLGIRLSMHSLMFVWSGCDSIGNLALYACTYVR